MLRNFFIHGTWVEKTRTVNDSTEKVLDNLNLYDENGKLKNAALLLFGKRPARFFTCVEFKIGRFGKDELLQVLYKNDTATYEEIALIIGVSRRTAARRIKHLIDNGYLIHQGSDKTGKWIITYKGKQKIENSWNMIMIYHKDIKILH